MYELAMAGAVNLVCVYLLYKLLSYCRTELQLAMCDNVKSILEAGGTVVYGGYHCYPSQYKHGYYLLELDENGDPTDYEELFPGADEAAARFVELSGLGQ